MAKNKKVVSEATKKTSVKAKPVAKKKVSRVATEISDVVGGAGGG